jgi:tetratricopeptide (TPR) repeat protein
LGWATAAEPLITLTLSSNLWRFWRIEGQLAEGREWLERSLEVADAPSDARARSLRGLSVIAEIQHDYATARVAAQEAMTLFDKLQDQGGIARCLEILGGLSQEEGDFEGATRDYTRTKEIYETLGEQLGVAVALGNLANVALLREDYESALELIHASMQLHEKHGHTEGMATSLLNEGLALLACGLSSRSKSCFRRALALATELHHKELVAVALEGLAAEAALADDVSRAARLLGAASHLRSDEQVPRDSLEERFYAITLRRLQEGLDRRGLDRLFAEGRTVAPEIVSSEVEG